MIQEKRNYSPLKVIGGFALVWILIIAGCYKCHAQTTNWVTFNATTQMRTVDGKTEYRLMGNSPKPPMGLTDSLNKKLNLSDSLSKYVTPIQLNSKSTTNQATYNSYYLQKTIDSTTTIHNRDGAKMGVLGKYLFLMGGWHPDTIPVTDNQVYRFNSSATSTVRIADAPWAGRHTYGFANSKDAIYVFGGDLNSGSYLPDSWKGTLAADSTINWTLLNSNVPWGERILFGSTYHNGSLYVIGGQKTPLYSDGSFGDVWKSTDGITWVKIADGLTQFAKNIVGGVVSYNGYIYVIGGGKYDDPLSNGTFDSSVWRSLDGVTWERLPDAPWAGRQYLDCVVYDGKIFCIGGNTSENTPTDNSKEIWSLDTHGFWQIVSNDITGRHASAVAAYKNMLVISTGNYWNDTWTVNKYNTSKIGAQNSIVVTDEDGVLHNKIFNAASGETGGYVIGSTDESPNGDASMYYSENTVLASKKGFVFYASSTPTSLPNLIIDEYGYIMMGRDGVIPTLNTDYLLNISGAFKSGGKMSWGLGSYVAGQSSIYNTPSDGTLIVPKTGSVTDLVLVNGVGSSVLEVPTGSVDVKFYGKISAVVAEYADNAAAISAGLAVGALYRSGDILKIVH